MSKRYAGVRHIKDNSFEIGYYPYPGARRKQYRVKAKSLKEASFIICQCEREDFEGN